MALLELAPTIARARIVALDFAESTVEDRHHLTRLALPPNQPGHELHGKVSVVEAKTTISVHVYAGGGSNSFASCATVPTKSVSHVKAMADP